MKNKAIEKKLDYAIQGFNKFPNLENYKRIVSLESKYRMLQRLTKR